MLGISKLVCSEYISCHDDERRCPLVEAKDQLFREGLRLHCLRLGDRLCCVSTIRAVDRRRGLVTRRSLGGGDGAEVGTGSGSGS